MYNSQQQYQGQQHNPQQPYQGQPSKSQIVQGEIPIKPQQQFQGQHNSQQPYQGQPTNSQNIQEKVPNQPLAGHQESSQAQQPQAPQVPQSSQDPQQPKHAGHGNQNMDIGSVHVTQEYQGTGPSVQTGHEQAQHHGLGSHGEKEGHQRVLHKDIGHEREHMKEHLDVPIDTSKMSDQELQFHYFKMHDTDGNNRLDGCELVKSLIHWHGDGSNHKPSSGSGSKVKIFQDQELAGMIDPILVSDDRNKDGFIDYYEFVAAQNAQVKAAV